MIDKPEFEVRTDELELIKKLPVDLETTINVLRLEPRFKNGQKFGRIPKTDFEGYPPKRLAQILADLQTKLKDDTSFVFQDNKAEEFLDSHAIPDFDQLSLSILEVTHYLSGESARTTGGYWWREEENLRNFLQKKYAPTKKQIESVQKLPNIHLNIPTKAAVALASLTLAIEGCSPIFNGLTPTTEVSPTSNTSEISEQDSRQEPDQMLIKTFKEYENYRTSHPELSLGELKYNKPSNYMEIKDLLGRPPTIEGLETNDMPASSFLRFSVEDIRGTKNLIQMNPGSGELDKIVDAVKIKFGSDPYANPSLLDNPQVVDYINQLFSIWVDENKNFVIDKKNETGTKVTLNELLLNFLTQNNGDIMKSLWDTTLFLKVLARNNPNDKSFGPQIENVKFLARNIQDDFAEESLSTVLAKRIDPYAPNGIVARSGILYHGENIMALAGCVDDNVMNIALDFYYLNKGQLEGEQQKESADIRVASYQDKIRAILEHYSD